MNEQTPPQPVEALADIDLQIAEKNAGPPEASPLDKEREARLREADQIAAEAREGALAKSIGTEPR